MKHTIVFGLSPIKSSS